MVPYLGASCVHKLQRAGAPGFRQIGESKEGAALTDRGAVEIKYTKNNRRNGFTPYAAVVFWIGRPEII